MAILAPKIVEKSIFSPRSRFPDPWLPLLRLSRSPSGCLHTLSHSTAWVGVKSNQDLNGGPIRQMPMRTHTSKVLPLHTSVQLFLVFIQSIVYSKQCLQDAMPIRLRRLSLII